MYKKHKVYITFIFLFVNLISSFFNLNYTNISVESLIVSVGILIIYINCLNNLSNANIKKDLKNTEDYKYKTKSQLGVVLIYYKNAIKTTLISICMTLFLKICSTEMPTIIYTIFLNLCISIFVLQFFYLYLILKFFINRQICQ